MNRPRPSAAELGRARRARNVALVLVGATIGWMAVQALGGRLGLPVAWAFVFDAMALAAFLWALAVTYQIWRQGRDS